MPAVLVMVLRPDEIVEVMDEQLDMMRLDKMANAVIASRRCFFKFMASPFEITC